MCPNGCPASNENPAGISGAPQPVVPASAVGLVSGGASAASAQHQPPYDLRRKSPHHDPAAASVAPNYPSGCNNNGNPGASGNNAAGTSSSSACSAGPSGYAACMLPARKRPRRTCYAVCDSKYKKGRYYGPLSLVWLAG